MTTSSLFQPSMATRMPFVARRLNPVLSAWLVAGLMTACGGSADSADAQPNLPQPSQADVSVLMMGNSHTAGNQLPQRLEFFLRAGLPGKAVSVVEAPGWMFLDERWADAQSMALLRSRDWTVVVLQAQKYSMSGTQDYPSDAAEALVREARLRKALPVLFPEWPRLGVAESARIYELHAAIARKEPACVAPMGQAWDLAKLQQPGLALHALDGNHSAAAGAHLAALVLYATITGAVPRGLPLQDAGLGAEVHQQLQAAAADAVRSVPPRQFCPKDQLLAGGG